MLFIYKASIHLLWCVVVPTQVDRIGQSFSSDRQGDTWMGWLAAAHLTHYLSPSTSHHPVSTCGSSICYITPFNSTKQYLGLYLKPGPLLPTLARTITLPHLQSACLPGGPQLSKTQVRILPKYPCQLGQPRCPADSGSTPHPKLHPSSGQLLTQARSVARYPPIDLPPRSAVT